MTDAWLIWGTLVWREGEGIVRLGKEVYHNHIIKEKQLNLDREADQLRDAKGTAHAVGFPTNPEQKWEELLCNSLLL